MDRFAEMAHGDNAHMMILIELGSYMSFSLLGVFHANVIISLFHDV